jgi:hypothetical protein
MLLGVSEPTDQRGRAHDGLDALVARHVRFGWLLVFVYVLVGMLLEGLHAFKLGMYLDVSNETRRLVWTLAHTHGTLIGVLNLAFGLTLPRLVLSAAQRRAASQSFVAAGVVMPLGFFLGGVVVYGGDPGLPILLAPLGGLFLVGAVGLAALGGWRGRAE